MTINHKINGLVSFASNSPGVPTGYGQQAEYLSNRMLKAGMTLAIMSNYGNESGIQPLKLKAGTATHYPRSFTGYSVDTLAANHNHFRSKHKDLPNAIFVLYDSWVYNGYPDLDKENVVIWAPIDHVTLPPSVIAFLKKPNVTVISMAPDGHEQLNLAGIENTYIPHVIDTKVYKPTFELRNEPTRKFLQIADDDFLVGMVAANKSNGLVHRKAFAENILAFSIFQRKYPNAKLYIHSEPSKITGGFGLANLLKACGIPADTVILPDWTDYRYGLSRENMAALYTAFDVLLATSYGEGFGVPTMEAQACGTRAIVSNWAASKDLVSKNSWRVEGMPFWDEPQVAWFKIPSIDGIVQALELAYQAERGVDQTSIDFASNFEDSKIWEEKWQPFWTDYFAKQSNDSSTESV
jgi:glycosyltransferase involved in cell wall biosynthesis